MDNGQVYMCMLYVYVQCEVACSSIPSCVCMPQLPAHPLFLNKCQFFVPGHHKHSFYAYSKPAKGLLAWESGLIEICFNLGQKSRALKTFKKDFV